MMQENRRRVGDHRHADSARGKARMKRITWPSRTVAAFAVWLARGVFSILVGRRLRGERHGGSSTGGTNGARVRTGGSGGPAAARRDRRRTARAAARRDGRQLATGGRDGIGGATGRQCDGHRRERRHAGGGGAGSGGKVAAWSATGGSAGSAGRGGGAGPAAPAARQRREPMRRASRDGVLRRLRGRRGRRAARALDDRRGDGRRGDHRRHQPGGQREQVGPRPAGQQRLRHLPGAARHGGVAGLGR